MTYVVTERCVNCRYTDCAEICPVSCFYKVDDPAMLVIDPDSCIDCSYCVPACPVKAIWDERELPAPYAEWLQKNKDLVKQGEQYTVKEAPLPGALTLAQIQERERARGWKIDEPSGGTSGQVLEFRG